MGAEDLGGSSTRDLYDDIYRRYYTKAVRLAVRKGAGADAEDIASEAMTRLWRDFGGFHHDRDPWFWIHRVVVNLCRDRARCQGRETPLADDNEDLFATADEESPEWCAIRTERAARLEAALRDLSETDRTLIDLREVRRLGVPAVAAVVGTSIAATRTRLTRARHSLKRAFTDHYGGPPAIVGPLAPAVSSALQRAVQDTPLVGRLSPEGVGAAVALAAALFAGTPAAPAGSGGASQTPHTAPATAEAVAGNEAPRGADELGQHVDRARETARRATERLGALVPSLPSPAPPPPPTPPTPPATYLRVVAEVDGHEPVVVVPVERPGCEVRLRADPAAPASTTNECWHR